MIMKEILTIPVPILDEEKNLKEIFIFTLLCGASKGFYEGLNKGLDKTFWGTAKKGDNKNSPQFLF